MLCRSFPHRRRHRGGRARGGRTRPDTRTTGPDRGGALHPRPRRCGAFRSSTAKRDGTENDGASTVNAPCRLSVNDVSKNPPDLAIIGAGSAGFAAAIRGAELGARVVLIGAGTIGGTCVNIGCVPSKTLIRAAEALHQAKAASRFAGSAATARLTDWAAPMAQKDALVGGLREAKYAALLPQYESIRYVEGAARFTAAAVVAGDEFFPAARVVIATGAAPAIPIIAGIETVPYLTSTTALALARLPRALLIVGGGVIGCELGQMFARFGVAVTIACRSH